MRIDVIETPDLGDRSYVVSSGDSTIVIDPQRDLDRVEGLLERLGTTLKAVAETHLHDDHVTGGHALARRHGAAYVVSGRDDVQFERCAAHGGDDLSFGPLNLHVVSTPGHTDNHLAYVVTDGSGEPPAVFSGGSLLYGSVGRTDLLGDDRTDDLTRKQFRSARRPAGSPACRTTRRSTPRTASGRSAPPAPRAAGPTAPSGPRRSATTPCWRSTSSASSTASSPG